MYDVYHMYMYAMYDMCNMYVCIFFSARQFKPVVSYRNAGHEHCMYTQLYSTGPECYSFNGKSPQAPSLEHLRRVHFFNAIDFLLSVCLFL